MDWIRYEGGDEKDRGKPVSESEAKDFLDTHAPGPEVQSSSIDEANGERFRVWLEKETGRSWRWVNKEIRELYFKDESGFTVRFSLRDTSGFLLRAQGIDHYFRKAHRCDRFYVFLASDKPKRMAWVDADKVREHGKLMVAGRGDREFGSDERAKGEAAYRVAWRVHTVKGVDLSEYGPGSQMKMF